MNTRNTGNNDRLNTTYEGVKQRERGKKSESVDQTVTSEKGFRGDWEWVGTGTADAVQREIGIPVVRCRKVPL